MMICSKSATRRDPTRGRSYLQAQSLIRAIQNPIPPRIFTARFAYNFALCAHNHYRVISWESAETGIMKGRELKAVSRH